MPLDRNEGNKAETSDLALITGRITIEIGLRKDDGARGILFLFEDLQNTDDDGDPQLLGYFDGKLMLGAASDDFYTKHFFPEDD